MKNIIKISITTIGTLAVLGTSVLALTGTVNAPNGLVLREEASKTANPITTLEDKAEVNIIEKDGEWYKVTYNSQEGYLFAEYVDTEEEADVPQEQEESPTDSTNNIQISNSLKVYNIPLITSTVIAEIDKEAEITIIKQITNWSYVSAGNIQGWVRTYGINNEVQTEIPTEPSEEVVTEPEEPTVSEPEEENPVTEEQEEEENYDEPSNSEQSETTSSATKGFVDVDSATVRKQATTDSEVVTYLIKGTSFKIKAETEEWYKIEYTDGITGTVYEGYIYKQLVTI